MSVLSWIVFFSVFFGIYFANVAFDQMVYKKWKFKQSIFVVIFMFGFGLISIQVSDVVAYLYVKNNIEHHWEEQIVSVQEVKKVVRSREQEGQFFLGIGNMYERETLRISKVNKDGTLSRDRIYTADCRFLKADKKQKKIEYVRNVCVYKNPADKKFFSNSYDVSDGFYKVYIL